MADAQRRDRDSTAGRTGGRSRDVTFQLFIKKLVDRIFGRRRMLDGSNSILLTFDDGPHPDVTPSILDRLRTYNVRAVFFVVGSRISRAPELLRSILAEGHLIGNHSYAHVLEADPWLPAYLLDMRRCQALLKNLTGQAPRLFRAPMGRYTMGGLVAPRLLGLRHILWSVDSEDWKLRDAEAALACGQRLCSSVQPGDIVLFHDDNRWTVTVLDVLLPHLASRGAELSKGAAML